MKNQLLNYKGLRLLYSKALFMSFLCFFGFSAFGQSFRVEGKVEAFNEGPLPGVSIVLKGTSNGTITDINGNFKIEVPNQESILVFSYVGYTTEEVAVGDRTNIAMELVPDIETLQELVIVGYGTQKKSDITGAVASVSAEELTQFATPDAVQALQGRAPGVSIISNSGEPGAGTKIRIRGIGTINNSNPIFVVDGFQTGDISFLNPNDIESMEILKDASATAIYGSQGSNGVVLITTKKGAKNGTVQFEFDTYAGVQTVANKIELANATEYATLRLEAFENDGISLEEDDPLFTRLNFVKEGGFEGTDWQDEVFRDAVIQNYSLSVSGGNEKSSFNLSATYFDQEGLIKNSELTKSFVRLNTQFELAEWLESGINVAFVDSDKTNYNDGLFSGVLPNVLRLDPVTPAFDVLTNNFGRADISQLSNAARIVEESRYDKSLFRKWVTNFWLEAEIINGLSLRSQFNVDMRNSHRRRYLPEFFIATDESRNQSSLFEDRGENFNWIFTNYLTYNRKVGAHDITGLLGTESQSSTFRGFNVTAFDVPENEDLQFLSAAKDTEFTVGSGQSEEMLLSYFGRINYAYDDKYLFTGNVRYDGSSRFRDGLRWGLFPSFSMGWVASEEQFLTDVSFLDFLKVRAGWGQVGNKNSVGLNSFVQSYSSDQLVAFGGAVVQGSAVTDLTDRNIQWEISETLNFGIDATFLDKINLTADYFIKQTKDMLVSVPVPGFLGAGPPISNAGTLENKGLEVALGYNNQEGLIRYEFNVNFATIKNEITSLGGGEPFNRGFISKVGNTTLTEVGSEIAYFYGLQTDGIFNTQEELDAYVNSDGNAIQPSAQPGDVKFVDANGDGLIDENDRVNLGSAIPDFTYGFSSTVGYKGFDLRVLIHGSQGNETVNALSRFNQSSDVLENVGTNRLDRWTPDNTNTNEPRVTSTDPNKNIETFSDRYVEDGSFIRLKNVQIGYNLPNTITDKVGLRAVRVYIAADNLLTVTDYTGFDPEISDRFGNPFYAGVDVANFPQPRVFRGGLNIKF